MDNSITCSKVKFANEEQAIQHINRIKSKSKRNKTPVRSYFCSYCLTWHLTSKPIILDTLIKKNENKSKLIAALTKKIEKLEHELKMNKTVWAK